MYQTYAEAKFELDEAKRRFQPQPRRQPLPAPPVPPALPTRSLNPAAETSIAKPPEADADYPYAHVGFKSSFGPQPVAGNRTSPSYSFGNGTTSSMRPRLSPLLRTAANYSSTPAPGAYESAESIGKQVLSPKSTSPSFLFSRMGRFDRDERENRHLQTPGPGSYCA